MDQLIVPVYLNQKVVFDLLAMLQGGISTVTAVTKTSTASNTEKNDVSVGFGLSEAFSTLLKIDLSGSKHNGSSTSDSNQQSEERIHTPASLFYQLRNLLIKNNCLNQLALHELPSPGEFVEFECTLQRNPLVETLDSLIEMLKLAEIFKTSQNSKPTKNKTNPNDFKSFRSQLTEFTHNIKAGSTIDLTSSDINNFHKAVITVDTTFLSDPLMADLVDGQFKVIGKVIRSVDESGAISLIRNTALSKMPAEKLSQFFLTLSKLGTNEGFGIPQLTPDIKGPAIQILPIAIYA